MHANATYTALQMLESMAFKATVPRGRQRTHASSASLHRVQGADGRRASHH
jgi:hypothetical protein